MLKNWISRLVMGLAPFCLVMPAHAQETPNIAAATDLRVALTDVAAAFERDTKQKVTLTFGSSGNFFQQLKRGAPFQLFLSADEGYVTELAKTGKTEGDGVLYAIGRLALVAPNSSSLKLDAKLNGLRAAIGKGEVSRFAIANPDHAPYGEKAREALEHAGLWQPLKGKLIMGDNVSQAAQFATAGGAQGGMVSYSLVLDPEFSKRARYVLLPASFHRPLRQRMVLMKGANAIAQRFFTYIQQPAARRILVRYGFGLPGEAR